jgi:hypothetical protein
MNWIGDDVLVDEACVDALELRLKSDLDATMASESVQVCRWVLKFECGDVGKHVSASDILASIGLPPGAVSVADVSASAWKSTKDVAIAFADVFGDDWKNSTLGDDEAARLFWKPAFVVVRHMSRLAATLIEPFLQIYVNSRVLYEQTLRDGDAIEPSAIVLVDHPYDCFANPVATAKVAVSLDESSGDEDESSSSSDDDDNADTRPPTPESSESLVAASSSTATTTDNVNDENENADNDIDDDDEPPILIIPTIRLRP